MMAGIAVSDENQRYILITKNEEKAQIHDHER